MCPGNRPNHSCIQHQHNTNRAEHGREGKVKMSARQSGWGASSSMRASLGAGYKTWPVLHRQTMNFHTTSKRASKQKRKLSERVCFSCICFSFPSSPHSTDWVFFSSTCEVFISHFFFSLHETLLAHCQSGTLRYNSPIETHTVMHTHAHTGTPYTGFPFFFFIRHTVTRTHP